MKVVTETEIREVPVEVYKPVPASLTDPLDYPQGHLDGEITVNDLLDLVFEFYDLLDTANEDRKSVAELTKPQPADESLP